MKICAQNSKSLIVFGASYCHYTQVMIKGLLNNNINFIYIAKPTQQSQHEFLKPTTRYSEKTSFPVYMLFTKAGNNTYKLHKWKDSDNSAASLQEIIQLKSIINSGGCCLEHKPVLSSDVYTQVSSIKDATVLFKQSKSFRYCATVF